MRARADSGIKVEGIHTADSNERLRFINEENRSESLLFKFNLACENVPRMLESRCGSLFGQLEHLKMHRATRRSVRISLDSLRRLRMLLVAINVQ